MSVYLAIGLSLAGVIGDYFLKLASESSTPYSSKEFAVGFVVYSSVAVGWVFVFQYLKLAAVGVIYGTSTTLFLVCAGLIYGERLSITECLGVLLGIAAIVLMGRFA